MAEGLDLREFVKTALLDVLGGITDAQDSETHGRFIAPVGIGNAPFPEDSGIAHSQRLLLSSVKFDVAVTVSSEGSRGAKGRLGISVVQASVGGEQTKRAENVSRIQFAVPLKFPRHEKPATDADTDARRS